MKNKLTVPGSLAAAFLSSSIAVVLMGIMVYLRGGVLKPTLEIYPALGTFGGIWLYSYLIWLVLWVILYAVMRARADVGSLAYWVNFFIVAVLLGIVIAEASFEWSTLFQ
jgi:hypothetical protein